MNERRLKTLLFVAVWILAIATAALSLIWQGSAGRLFTLMPFLGVVLGLVAGVILQLRSRFLFSKTARKSSIDRDLLESQLQNQAVQTFDEIRIFYSYSVEKTLPVDSSIHQFEDQHRLSRQLAPAEA